MHGVPQFAISIALERAGDVIAATVYEPIRDELFWAVKEVGRPVEWIDDPQPLVVGALGGSRFLHQQAERGTRLRQLGAQDLLGLQVGLGDEVGRTLARDLELFDLAKIANQPAPRLT